MKKPISVIISAYKAEQFIEECLNSVQNQSYFKDYDDYEILLGIDGCEETKNTILNIRNKYKKLRLFWFEENNGAYLVFNTLINNSKYDTICIFGADDIMRPNHIQLNINLLRNNSFVKSKCTNFNSSTKKLEKTYNPDGLVFFNKMDFMKINGFDNWRCGADTDFNKRMILNKITLVNNKVSTSLRRIHGNSLTNVKEYKYGSEYRRNITNLIRLRRNAILDNFNIYPNVKEI